MNITRAGSVFARAPGLLALLAVLGSLASPACKPKTEKPDSEPVSVAPALSEVPPAFGGVGPAGPAGSAADADGSAPKTQYEQAEAYWNGGQVWMARLVLENQALSPAATPEETELLAKICAHQVDRACLEACSSKLGRKIEVDAGAVGTRSKSEGVKSAAREPSVEELMQKGEVAQARQLLEPKVLDGKATQADIKNLKAICARQGDKMCIALCNAKLR